MSYDLFFRDLTNGNADGLTIALKLREMGVTAPIVLCSSNINYLSQISSTEETADFMHLNKPILTTELCVTLDKAISMQQNRIPTIELRSEKDTQYVQEDDIVYALPKIH